MRTGTMGAAEQKKMIHRLLLVLSILVVSSSSDTVPTTEGFATTTSSTMSSQTSAPDGTKRNETGSVSKTTPDTKLTFVGASTISSVPDIYRSTLTPAQANMNKTKDDNKTKDRKGEQISTAAPDTLTTPGVNNTLASVNGSSLDIQNNTSSTVATPVPAPEVTTKETVVPIHTTQGINPTSEEFSTEAPQTSSVFSTSLSTDDTTGNHSAPTSSPQTVTNPSTAGSTAPTTANPVSTIGSTSPSTAETTVAASPSTTVNPVTSVASSSTEGQVSTQSSSPSQHYISSGAPASSGVPPATTKHPGGGPSGRTIAIGVIVSLVIIAVIIAGVCIYRRRLKRSPGYLTLDDFGSFQGLQNPTYDVDL